MELDRLDGKKVYLDSNFAIYAIELFEPAKKAVSAVLAALDQGRFQAVTSELAIAEVLVRPIRDGDVEVEEHYLDFFGPWSLLAIEPVSRDVLVEAARVRSVSTARLPDAIHLASAKVHKCTHFLSNDRKLASLVGTLGMQFIYLEDIQP